ncbi:MAG: DUF928 domain-containing protein [Hydrococcus sp. Prado102]|jgi:hypothetical protein|nr:DUF928 domain-containing protein [Hydrococcus sp. Prado102]
MLRQIHIKNILAIASATSLFSLSLLCLPALSRGQETDNNSNLGLPTRRIGGGTRGGSHLKDRSAGEQCSSLVALGPKYLVSTTEATPTLFFCLPSIEQPREAKLELSLYDDNDNLVSQTTITPTEQSGIASLPLPTSEGFKELESDRNYRWHLSLVEQGTKNERVVEGWIRRVEMKPNLADKLAEASPIERVQLYQQARLWYEALEELARLKRSNPDDEDVSEQWTALLEGFNLGAIVQVPLLDPNLPSASSRS